jgi:hypothetical protein
VALFWPIDTVLPSRERPSSNFCCLFSSVLTNSLTLMKLSLTERGPAPCSQRLVGLAHVGGHRRYFGRHKHRNFGCACAGRL